MNNWVRHFLIALVAVAASAANLQAQATGEIRGFVIDGSMMAPLNDVTIEVAGQTVFSAQQGYFLVEDVPSGVYTLTASTLGYRSFETQVTVTAGTTTDVEVRMAVAPLEMAPIVAVGYGELEAKNQTGVVTEVPAEAFNTGRIVSAEELIQAKVAGVQVTANSNEPGSGISIRIRGGTSDQRQQRTAVRDRRRSAGRGRWTRLGRRWREESPELPEPERHRVVHGAEGCIRDGHLRVARRQRRRAHRDDGGPSPGRSGGYGNVPRQRVRFLDRG